MREVGIVIENEMNEKIEGLSILKILSVNEKRYAVLQKDDDDIYFATMDIDHNGATLMRNIKSEEEFKYVQEAYQKSL